MFYSLSEAVPTTCADDVSSALKRKRLRLPSPSTLPVITILAPAIFPILAAVLSSTSPESPNRCSALTLSSSDLSIITKPCLRKMCSSSPAINSVWLLSCAVI